MVGRVAYTVVGLVTLDCTGGVIETLSHCRQCGRHRQYECRRGIKWAGMYGNGVYALRPDSSSPRAWELKNAYPKVKTIDKVGQLLWAWYSCPRKSADKIVEPWHTADFIVCNLVRYQPASRIHNSRMQVAKWYLRYFFLHLINENNLID